MAKQWKKLYRLTATFICPYCQKEFPLNKATVEHLVPRSRGGTSDPENIVYACKFCNNQKGSLTPEEYQIWRTTLDIEEWKRLEFIRNGKLSQEKGNK